MIALREQKKALDDQSIATACKARDVRMCERLVKDRQGNEGMSRQDAILAVTAPAHRTLTLTLTLTPTLTLTLTRRVWCRAHSHQCVPTIP